MKIPARVFSLVILIALLFSGICGCSGNGADTTDETTEAAAHTDADSETEEEMNVARIVLIDSQSVKISVTCDDDAYPNAAGKLTSALECRYGCTVPQTPGSAEISVVFKKSGTRDDWSITAGKDSVIFASGSGVAATAAVEAFLRLYTFGTDMTLSVPEGEILSYNYARDKIDNSGYLSYIPSSEVSLIDTNGKGKIMSPEWIDSLIIVELRPLTASIGGQLRNSYDLLDFYAEAGVNCVWLTPIYEYGPGGNGYGNTGVHRIGENLTGTSDQERGWEEMRKFVDHAHEKGIYVLFDVITWGVMRGTELTKSHPDWFSGEAWGNDAFNWKNEELKEWFTQRCIENIMKTGADGFRCDCEPNYTGYALFEDVRQRLADQGKYVIIISEDGSDRRRTYDFEQDGVLWYAVKDRGGVYSDPLVWYVDGGLDIVESVKTGKGLGAASVQNTKKAGSAKYYTNCITNHDYQRRIVKGNRLRIGYAAITAPFIPLWYMGDEFNCTWQPAVQYDMTVQYEDAEKPSNRRFLEDVKRMIAVRRTYKDIFEYWPDDHRKTNVCAVVVAQDAGLTAYARYAGNKAVLILPNNNETANPYFTATVPLADCGIDGFKTYRVTDLWSGEELCVLDRQSVEELSTYVPYESFAMILIEGIE